MLPTVETVGLWIIENVLDSAAWDNSEKQKLAVTQAIRNLERWYPEVELTDELVAYQSIWEIKGTDPALKFQRQGVKAVSEGSDRIDYDAREKVAPDVRGILGAPVDESITLEGGALL
jgi:hypothetical protein